MWKALRKELSEQDKEAARRSVQGLNDALGERFGGLPNVQIVSWIGDIHLHHQSEYDRLSRNYVDHVDTGRQFLLAMEEMQALRPSADMLVIGGDLTDYSLPDEWREFRRLLDESGWTKPVVPALGNHDNKNQSGDAAVREALQRNWAEIRRADWPEINESGELFYSVTHSGLHVIVLDTMRDRNYRISEQQKSWLHRELQETKLPTLVVCHRHFLNIGNWADEELIVRDKELWTMLDESPFIIGVFSGHVHYPRLWQYRRKLYGTFPSAACGIGSGTGWGGIVLRDRRIAAVFYKELYGEGFEYYTGPAKQDGKFAFMEPEPFRKHVLCNPYYWPPELE